MCESTARHSRWALCLYLDFLLCVKTLSTFKLLSVALSTNSPTHDFLSTAWSPNRATYLDCKGASDRLDRGIDVAEEVEDVEKSREERGDRKRIAIALRL